MIDLNELNRIFITIQKLETIFLKVEKNRIPQSGLRTTSRLRLIKQKIANLHQENDPGGVIDECKDLLEEALQMLENIDTGGPGDNDDKFKIATYSADVLVRRCYYMLKNAEKESKPVLNSELLYKKLIEEKEKETEDLSAEIEKLRREHSTAEEDRKLLLEKEAELEKTKSLLQKFKEQEQEKQIRDDAVATWEKKITAAFEILDRNISPIKTEHKRLRFLYWCYNILSVGIIVLLVIAEIIICKKIHAAAAGGLPAVIEYLSIILPIPVALGLLWGFITQANRAQRQMVVLSRFIHDIKYTEGILLAINNLSTDTTDSTRRINSALDKLLEKHLSHDLWSLHREDLLKEEEKKDNVPLDTVIDILKNLRK